MKIQHQIISSILFSLIFAFSVTASGQEETAQDFITQAKQAYDKEDYALAIEHLLAANGVEPNARLLFNVAKSYGRLNDCDRAIVYFKAYLRQDDAESELRDTARAEIKKLKSCQTVSPLSGRLFIKSTPEGAKIEIDGEHIGNTPLEYAGIQTGEHTVSISSEGYQDEEREIDALQDSDQSLSFRLEEKMGKPIEAIESMDTLPYIISGSTLGVGLGVLGYAIVQNVNHIDKKAERNEIRKNASVEPVLEEKERLQDLDKKMSAEIKANINGIITTYVIGGTLATLGAGYLLYTIIDQSAPTEDIDSLVIAPMIDGERLGISVMGRF